jgi:hypothetical protein
MREGWLGGQFLGESNTWALEVGRKWYDWECEWLRRGTSVLNCVVCTVRR